MFKNSEKYRHYSALPFWSVDQEVWYKAVNDLKEEKRNVLEYFPFQWVYVPPHNSETAVEFLCDIGVDDGKVKASGIDTQFENMTPFNVLEEQDKVEWGGEFDENPLPGFGMIPEWGPMAGVILNWPIFYPPLWDMFRQMIVAFDHVTTFLRIPEGYLGAAALAWLEANEINLDKIQPIPGPIGDSWARDYSPIYGLNLYTGEPVAHKFSFAAFFPKYRKIYKSIVEIDDKFTWKDGYKVFRTPIKMDGGNILTDGNGTYVLTRRILSDNAGITNLYAQLESWLGADRLIIVDEEPNDLLGHINHFKFISPTQILVGKPDDKQSPVYKYLSKLAKLFNEYGYEVVDVPAPQGFDRMMPGGDETHTALYANSLMVNKRILIAVYDEDGLKKYNDQAIDAYQKALPDYEVIPIEASIQGNVGGAINCSTKEVPDITKMKI